MVTLIVLAVLLVSCGKGESTLPAPPPGEDVAEDTVEDTEESADDTEDTSEDEVAEEETVEEVDEELGRIVVAVTDDALEKKDITSYIVELADLEIIAEDGNTITLSSAKKEFNLSQLEEDSALWLDVPVDPGIYEKIGFRFNDVDIITDDVEYDLETIGNVITVDAMIDIEAGSVSTVTLDFDIKDSVFIAGNTGYFKPIITITTTKDSEVEIDNTTVEISGGTIIETVKYTSYDIYTDQQLNNTQEDCEEECGDFCEGGSDNECTTECKDETGYGCSSEDEEFCRKTCEPFMHPVFCRDGCQLDSVAECQSDFALQCDTGCNATESVCLSDCTKDCEVTT